MFEQKIVRIEQANLLGERPRKAGCNSRLGEHGLYVRPSIVTITTDQGAFGFGASRISQSEAEKVLGKSVGEIFQNDLKRVRDGFRPIEFPIWDLIGQLTSKPVYSLVRSNHDEEFTAPCYDTSLYIDDLHLTDHYEAADLIAQQAQQGMDKGHTAFKIKIGRGAMHMDLSAGMQRDIMVIKAVRQNVGQSATVLLDANNGYNLNLTKTILAETADDKIHWIEEAFHEDNRLYENLKDWMHKHSIQTLVADGEGEASIRLLDWAEAGLIDVVQYDIFSYGFSRWLDLGHKLDGWNIYTAPHHYGGYYGNFASAHLKNGIRNFKFVEWDAATVSGIDDSSYKIQNGHVLVPNRPGFGLILEKSIFHQAVAKNGFSVEL